MMYRTMAVVCATLSASVANAQAPRNRIADSLLAAGAVSRAESLYYAAARERPRDPIARWALGRYLWERGAWRVAATLLEEADQFGGEQVAPLVNVDLARIDMALGEYHSLAALSHSPLTAAERDRVKWLDQHPTRLVAPDSMLSVSYTPTLDGRIVGHLPIRVQGHPLDAAISTMSRGLTICDSVSVVSRLHRFADTRGGAATSADAPAVADSIAIGRLSFTNYPISVAPARCSGQAVLGIDVLSRLAPTFDPRARTITMRVDGAYPVSSGGEAFITRLTSDNLLIARAGGWLPASDPAMARMLGERRWTLDGRRGLLRLER